jgi:hypothetical protein
MVTHQEGIPQFDMLQAAKALRCYAGALSLIASATATPRISRSQETQLAAFGASIGFSRKSAISP